MMRWLGILMAAATSGLIALSPPVAAGPSGPLDLVNRQMPLPTAPWQLVGRGLVDRDGLGRQVDAGGALPDGGVPGGGLIEQAALFLVDGDTVTAFALVQTNLLPARDGWGLTRDCDGGQGYLRRVHYETESDGLCSFAAAAVIDGSTPGGPAWSAAVATARAAGWRLPADWQIAGIRLTTRRDLVDVRYGFATERWPQIADRAPHQVLPPWIQAMAELVVEGQHNQLPPAAVVAMPWRAALSLTAARHADARRRLDLLAAEGLAPLDEAPDFAPLINAASGSTEPPPPPEPAAKVSPLYRLVTYRVSGLISSIGINMAFTGDLMTSAAIYATSVSIGSVWFYLNERLWSDFLGDQVHQQRRLELPVPGAWS